MNLQSSTKAFMTKTMRIERKNPAVEGFWPIAIDVGYSAVKVFSPNVAASFPSFAKKVSYGKSDSSIGRLPKSAICYRDNERNEYFVGSLAQKLIDGEADSSTASIYVRDRYYSPEFKVLVRTGLALSMLDNEYGNANDKIIRIKTGLPSGYFSGNDSKALLDVFHGEHDFYIKLGEGGWQHFCFRLNHGDVDLMAQPMGTLFSLVTNANGKNTPKAEDYFRSKLLVLDPGFGTLDTFDIKNGIIANNKTWNDLGMKKVFEELSNSIEERYGVYVPVFSMQDILEQGYFLKTDRKTHSSQRANFDDLLHDAVVKVATRALNVIDDCYNAMEDHKYLVVTGGTGQAWLDFIKDYYKNMENLIILSGWETDSLPAIFSNVRGYYYHLRSALKLEKRLRDEVKTQ